MKKAFGIAAIATLIGTPAWAADMAVKAPPPVPAAAPYSWTGFYIGANAGYGWGGENVSYSPNDPAAVDLFAPPAYSGSAPVPNNYNVSGAIGGFQLGYNWQFNRAWVAGLETDFDWSGVRGSGTSSGTVITGGGNEPFSDTASEKIDWFGTIRARLGYLISENLLTYATGGLAYGRIDRSGNYANTGTAISYGSAGVVGGFSWNCNANSICFLGSSQSVDLGWAAGAGLEYAAWSNITVKVEYLYVSLNNKSVVETNTAPAPGTIASSISANYGTVGINIIRAGVNYRF